MEIDAHYLEIADWIDDATLLGSAAGSFLLGVALLWWCTRRLARPVLPRVLALALLALGAYAAAHRVPVPTEEGTWYCGRCGDCREELRYLDWTVLASPTVAPTCAGAGGDAAGHAWARVGCHVYGRDSDGTTSVGCSICPIL